MFCFCRNVGSKNEVINISQPISVPHFNSDWTISKKSYLKLICAAILNCELKGQMAVDCIYFLKRVSK